MILLIPLGGKGIRFKSQKFNEPKVLINVENKPIIFWLLDNIKFNEDIEFIYIPYNYEYTSYNFENLLINRYTNFKFKFLRLENDTLGASHTINIALNQLLNENIIDSPILCLDADNFYTIDIIEKWNKGNMIFTFIDYSFKNKNYSYILKNEENKILMIREKELFENYNNNYYACCGAYGFQSYKELYKYTCKIIEKGIKFKNEYYTSCVIQEMINDNIDIYNNTIENRYYFSLGTPEQIEYFKYIFLFDLDGTLIDTDTHYINIWNIILNKYNIIVDKVFFEKNIFFKKLFSKKIF